jgi:2-hydroxy-4-carboxymuconate semialdehyde hemiacetal dehydrogenase
MDGPLGTFFRYIGDNAIYIARYDDLFNGKDEKSTCPRWTFP